MLRTPQEELRAAKLAISRKYAHNVVDALDADRQDEVDRNPPGDLPTSTERAAPSKRTVDGHIDEEE